MGSRWVRTVVVIAALATLGFAGNQIRLSNTTLADEQNRERVFADLGWTLRLTLADLRSAQQANVADGQDREYWTAQVDALLQEVLDGLDNLRGVADPSALDTLDGLDAAVVVVADIRELDENARGLIDSDQPLQASDDIFSTGFDLVDRASAHVQAALQAERTTRADVMRAARSTQATMMWTAAIVIVLAMLMLAPTSASAEPDSSEDAGDYAVPESAGLSLLSLDDEPSAEVVDPPPAGGEDGESAAGSAAPDAGGRPSPDERATPDLAAIAALCTDFSNLTDRDQLPDLLARTAALMNASGIIIWVSNESARTLRPALGHGYASGILERIGTISHVGANPTSAAFNTRRIQVVESRESDAGGLAAPLMVADRCIGVLSAELREGWESSDAVHATASIVAAQLAPLLPSDAPAAEPLPAAATGTHDTAGAGPATETGTPPRGA